MADYFEEMLKAAQGNALASNPYVQYGSAFGQAQNPYLGYKNADPYQAYGAMAVQGALSGLLSGYGQGQVNKDMAQITPQLQQLYNDPLSAQKPDDVDLGLWNSFAQAGLLNNLQGKREIQQAGLLEASKLSVNPQTKLNQTQALAAKADLLERMDYMQREQPELFAKLTGQAPQGAVQQLTEQVPTPKLPTPDQVLKAEPAQAPAAKFTAAGAEGPKLIPVPTMEEAMGMFPGLAYDKRREKAAGVISSAVSENLKIQRDFVKPVKEDKAAAAPKADDGFDATDQALNVMANAIKDIPRSYGGTLGGVTKWLNTQGAVMLPEGSDAQAATAKATTAVSLLNSAKPISIAPLRQEVLKGSTSDKDVAFLLQALPSDDFNIKEANFAIMNNLLALRDLRKTQRLFKAFGESNGWSDEKILQQWDGLRAKSGGSFLNRDGSLKNSVGLALKRLGGTL
jgi:hypothetical protein